MCAGAAVVAAGSAALGGPVALQLAVFAGSALMLLLLARPAARRHLERAQPVKIGIGALIGAHATVLRKVDANGGLVKLRGEEWSARPYDPLQVLEVGQDVAVMEIRGATAIVWGEP
ncbi:MAG: NfeD family protein [Actinobacteria bacterium]|nr:NfeD family protein [Actinomycetota bacterium]